jgi:putative transposase
MSWVRFPDTFGCIEDSRVFCQRFFRWYNTEHRHSGVAWHTPRDVHYGHAEIVQAKRADVLTAAYTRNPERFVRRPPQPAALPHRGMDQQTNRPRRRPRRLKESLRTLPQRS